MNSLWIPLQRFFASALTKLTGLGPYLLVELVLPGGSLIALLLWLYNHRAPRKLT